MKSIELEGKTVEDALNKALIKLNVSEDMVNVEIINQGSKGIFGVIGVKSAKIRVTKKYNYIEEAQNFITNILKSMDLKAVIDIKEESEILKINVSGTNMGLVIGYRGETLDSIQYLVSLLVNKNHELPHKKVILDIENYRKKREQTLKDLADKSAAKVVKNRRTFKLEPMNSYERKIIHAELQNNNLVSTYSEGTDPFRRVVIELKE